MSFTYSFKSLILFFAIFLESNLFALCNLEDRVQGFVLENKKIAIPGYPQAFNPSIVRWNDILLMSFRIVSMNLAKSTGELEGYVSRIGLVWLDDDFNPITYPQLLNLSLSGEVGKGREEDARLVIVNSRLYIVYSDNKEENFSDAGFRVNTAEISYDGHRFHILNNQILKTFEGENPRRREKNWTPFEMNGELHFAYTINPHLILKPISGTDKCETLVKTYTELPWSWGDPRGGTPALRIDDSHYLSFFHSLKSIASVHSDGKYIDHYFMGAYTFSTSPPFQVTGISPEPIIGKNFYCGNKYPYYWRPIVVIFPCGFIWEGDFIWVCYGRQDHEIWITKMNAQALFQSLVPVP